nr:hypothetical protein [Rhodospirillales bacterium]
MCAIQHMNERIDPLLALAKWSRSDVKIETVKLSSMVSELIADMQEQEPKRKYTLRLGFGYTGTM